MDIRRRLEGEGEGDGGYGVFLQPFGADGAASANPVRVSPDGASLNGFTRLADGTLLLTSTAGEWDAESWQVCTQRVAAEGCLLGEQLVVGEEIIRAPVPGTIALPDGGWLVCWGSWSSTEASSARLAGQRFGADAAPLGTGFEFDADGLGFSYANPVALASGEVFLAWNQAGAGRHRQARSRFGCLQCLHGGLGSERGADSPRHRRERSHDHGTPPDLRQRTGALYYDPDGAGGVDAMQFAQLGAGTHPVLRAADFVIVG